MKLRRITSVLLTPAACLLMAGALVAQLDPPNGGLIENPDGWPDTEALGKTVVGDMTGEGVLDMVVLSGNQPCLVFNPDVHNSIVDMTPYYAKDIAMLRNDTFRDELLTVGVPGLRAVSQVDVDDGNGGLVAEFVHRDLETNFWVDARLVEVCDLDGDGDLDIVGVAADGITVLTMLQDASNNFSPWTSFTAIDTVMQLVTAEFNTFTLQKDVGLLTLEGVQVYSVDAQGATLLTDVRTVHAGDCITVVSQPNMADRIVLATHSGPGVNQVLVNIGPSGNESPVYIDSLNGPDPLDIVALAATDHDDDGDDDLIIHHQWDHELWVVENNAENPSVKMFKKAIATTLPTGGTGPLPNTNTASPGTSDLNGDGTPDAGMAAQENGFFGLHLGPFPGGPTPPTPYTDVSFCCGMAWPEPDETFGIVTADFTLVDLVTPTHLQVLIWEAIDDNGNEVLHPNTRAHYLYPIAEVSEGGDDYSVSIVLPDSDEPSASANCAFSMDYYLEIRLVTFLDPVIRTASQPITASIHPGTPQGNEVQLDAVSCPGEPDPPGGQGFNVVAGWTPMATFPEIQGGQRPVVSDPKVGQQGQ